MRSGGSNQGVRMMMFLLFAVAQAASGPAEPPEAAAYTTCVAEQTKRLIPSQESADAIATAATFLCAPKLEAAARAIDRASSAEVRARGFNYPADLDSSFKVGQRLQEMARSMAITAVVESRLSTRH